MPFVFFILLNATIFIRPSEWYAPVYEWPIYQCVIAACLIISWRPLLRQISWESIQANPINACVLGLLLILTLSWAANPTWDQERSVSAYEFAKIIVYYLLLVGLIDSRARLDRLLLSLGWLIPATAAIVVLHYHGLIQMISQASAVTTTYDPTSGTSRQFVRLGGPGSYLDANDFAVFLVIGLILCAHLFIAAKRRMLRFWWFVPTGLLGYALWLTNSRGGFLAMLGATTAWIWANWGLRRAFLLGAPVCLVLSSIFSERMTNIDFAAGTGQARVQMWASALMLVKQHPLLGIGPGNIGSDLGGAAAHNAFISAYAELGFVGGSLFVGAFLFVAMATWKLASMNGEDRSDGDRRSIAAVFAITVGFVVGNLALSQQYAITTYLILGLGAACFQTNRLRIPDAYSRTDFAFFTRLCAVSVAFLLGAHVFVQFSVRW